MHLGKPQWIQHEGEGIYAIDIQPHGHRIATCGGNTIKLWSLLVVLKPQPEENLADYQQDKEQQNINDIEKMMNRGDKPKSKTSAKKHPGLIATLSDHYEPVNDVKWSTDGKLLATAGDDTMIMLYHRLPGKLAGNLESVNQETWKVLRRLRGHSANVTGICWSPDSTMLASCSIDNSAIIWDVKSGAPTKKLQNHTSFVLGIAWDPLGRYLATQSQDKSVIIWNTESWSVAKTVTECLKNSLDPQFYLRPSWSPDGRELAIVNAFENPAHTVHLVKRDDWGMTTKLAGHKSAIIVASYNPRIFLRGGKACVCIALGSSDRTISVWIMDTPRPLIVFRKLFMKSVSGISWSSDGNVLLASSFDGSVSFVRFGKAELGERLGAEELKQFMDNMYGRVDGAVSPIASVELIQKSLDDRLLGRREGKEIVSSSVQNNAGYKRNFAEAVVQQGCNEEGLRKRARMDEFQEQGQKTSVVQQNGVQTELRHGRALLPLQIIENQGQVLSPIGLKQLIMQDVEAENGKQKVQLVIKNSQGEGQSQRAEVQLQRGAKEIIWKNLLKTRVLAATGSQKYTAVATTENTIMVFSPAGRYLLNPMCISAPPVFMKANDSMGLLLLTQNADLMVWDLHQKKLTLKTSILPLIAPNYSDEINNQNQNSEDQDVDEDAEDESESQVEEEENSSEGGGTKKEEKKSKKKRSSAKYKHPREVILMSNGQALVVMDDFNAYVWSEDMGMWMRIADDSHPMSVLFNHFHKSATESKLNLLQRQAHEFGQQQRRKILGSIPRGTSSQLQDSFQHLECSMCAAECLSNQQEYKNYLKSYILYLVINQKQEKLTEVCSELLGPDRWLPETHSDVSCWQPCVIGMQKRKLLREVVLEEILTQKKFLQFYLDIKRRLDAAENHVLLNREQCSQNKSQLLQLLSQ